MAQFFIRLFVTNATWFKKKNTRRVRQNKKMQEKKNWNAKLFVRFFVLVKYF